MSDQFFRSSLVIPRATEIKAPKRQTSAAALLAAEQEFGWAAIEQFVGYHLPLPSSSSSSHAPSSSSNRANIMKDFSAHPFMSQQHYTQCHTCQHMHQDHTSSSSASPSTSTPSSSLPSCSCFPELEWQKRYPPPQPQPNADGSASETPEITLPSHSQIIKNIESWAYNERSTPQYTPEWYETQPAALTSAIHRALKRARSFDIQEPMVSGGHGGADSHHVVRPFTDATALLHMVPKRRSSNAAIAAAAAAATARTNAARAAAASASKSTVPTRAADKGNKAVMATKTKPSKADKEKTARAKPAAAAADREKPVVAVVRKAPTNADIVAAAAAATAIIPTSSAMPLLSLPVLSPRRSRPGRPSTPPHILPSSSHTDMELLSPDTHTGLAILTSLGQNAMQSRSSSGAYMSAAAALLSSRPSSPLPALSPFIFTPPISSSSALPSNVNMPASSPPLPSHPPPSSSSHDRSQKRVRYPAGPGHHVIFGDTEMKDDIGPAISVSSNRNQPTRAYSFPSHP